MKRSKLSLVRSSAPSTAPSAHRVSSCHGLLVAAARREVGRVDIAAVVDVLREAMLREALERAGGNITHASDLLGITRQAVQQLIRRFELADWHRNLREHEGSEAESLAEVLHLAR